LASCGIVSDISDGRVDYLPEIDALRYADFVPIDRVIF
jgi:hypothetical protein